MSDPLHQPPLRTFRLVCRQQPDGTWYGGLHAPGVCVGAYSFASRDLAWSFAWKQQQRIVRLLEARLADEVDDCPADGTPRDPHSTQQGMFRLHNCSRCNDGARPCVRGNPRQCEHPHARDD